MLLTASLVGFCACALFFFYSPGAHWVYALIFLAAIGMADGMYTPSANKTALGSIPGAEKQHAAVFLPLAVNVGTTFGVLFFEIVFTLPLPKGEAVFHGKHSLGITDMVLANGFQSAFFTGAVLWGSILIYIILIGNSTFARA